MLLRNFGKLATGSSFFSTFSEYFSFACCTASFTYRYFFEPGVETNEMMSLRTE
jgi:hypothetical protein